MSAIAATDRMTRLIAAIPWIVAQDGAPLDEIAERFDYPRNALVDDLQNVVFYVGVPPYTPDTLIEVQIDDDLVWIDYADWFSRPMRLTGGEALALLAAGESVLAFDPGDDAGALARGLAKLRLATGADPDALDIDLGTAPEAVLRVLRQGLADGRAVTIRYYSFARDARTTRLIEPTRFFAEAGNWYVAAYCHLAEGDRVFRVDRIEDAVISDEPVTRGVGDAPTHFSIDEQPRVRVRLPRDRAPVLDSVVVDALEDVDDETVVATLPASSPRWLERLLVRIGPGVSVSTDDPTLARVDPADAARRLLDRYSA